MELVHQLHNSLISFKDKEACHIGDTSYTYGDLGQAVSNIRKALRQAERIDNGNFGIVGHDEMETYAAIIALWFEGKTYVPLSPDSPKDRNLNVIKQAEIRTIIDTAAKPLVSQFDVINPKQLDKSDIDLVPRDVSEDVLAYILFTSGTTGTPKGVPITRSNVAAYIYALEESGYKLTSNDRCLQMFELTFDFSVMAYLFPLLRGASMFTIPKGEIKFSYIYQLMSKFKLTALPMVPSVINFLRPFFSKINASEVRYSIFCGEALQKDVTLEWSKSLPNSEIINYYGPTECTVFCSYYKVNLTESDLVKAYNGVISIGKAMEGTELIIIDENNDVLSAGDKGELCISSTQLTPGYWKNEEKNKATFFNIEMNSQTKRFYKTGDLCSLDEEGDFAYVGRIDFQTKVNGFRVELSEIEFHAKAYLDQLNCVAIAWSDINNNSQVGLVIESSEFELEGLLEHLKTQMPPYMIPIKTVFISKLPYNASGKTDRKTLEKMF